MTWFKVDSHFSGHPAVLKAGDSAMGLWLRLGCWLATFPEQVDEVPYSIARRWGTKRQIERLLDAELLLDDGETYRLNHSMAIVTSGLSGRSWELDATAQRRTIPNELRARIYDRDGRACVECGATSELTLDHIWPWSLGGTDTIDNLRTLCRPCNSRKGARV